MQLKLTIILSIKPKLMYCQELANGSLFIKDILSNNNFALYMSDLPMDMKLNICSEMSDKYKPIIMDSI